MSSFTIGAAMTKPISEKQLDQTKRLMAALGRMPAKPHEEIKLGKTSAKKATSPERKHASAKPKTV